jgi:tetratricopeptide (TPR) repeat protein/outer membrane biosynthesis protein TonB
VFAQTPDIKWYTKDPKAKKYQLSTADELAGLAALVNNTAGLKETIDFKDKTITLAKDIDLSKYCHGSKFNNGKGWIPVGNCVDEYGECYGGVEFGGTFDGNGKTISGLASINKVGGDPEGRRTYNPGGLFGIVSGSLKNLGVVGANITGGGGIVGTLVDGSVSNCYFSGAITGDTTNGPAFVGGIVGWMRGGKVTNSHFTGTASGNDVAGGIVGDVGMFGKGGVVLNCYSIGTVRGGSGVGGIVGSLRGSSGNSRVTNCYSTAAISGVSSVGGIVGYVSNLAGTKEYFNLREEIIRMGFGSTGQRVNEKDLAKNFNRKLQTIKIFDTLNTGVSNNVALNASVKATGSRVRIPLIDMPNWEVDGLGFEPNRAPDASFNGGGRVVGGNDAGRLSGNAAFSGILNTVGNTMWDERNGSGINGEDISIDVIKADGTLGGRFTRKNGWVVQNGRLPGLLVEVVDMPTHLSVNRSHTPTPQPVLAPQPQEIEALPVFAQKKTSKEEVETQIRALEQKKQQEQANRMKAADANRPQRADLETIITKYEKLLDDCAAKKSDRCADVMYTLGSLYYDQGRDDFGKASERHAEAMKQYDRTGRGTPPTPLIPDYTKSLRMYWQLSREYPSFPKLPEAYYQMSQNYLVAGHLDTARIILEQLSQRFPNSPRVSAAQFRLGELAFMDNNFNKAYEHFKKVRKDQIDIISWEMNQYRLAECAYNTGDFDKAVEYFYNYVEACDRNEYTKKEFREMALEYMAISFSDMPNGFDEAVKFFNKNSGKPYEEQVIYMVGSKNRDHGQWDAAIDALSGALKKYPMYKDAPLARQKLIECFVVKKEHEKANKERESLIDDYGEGSKWYSANSKERKVIDIARGQVRRALGDIAIFYHGEGQKKKDKASFDKAMKRYNEFFSKFPDDKWRVFEYKYNVAEIYSSMGDCEKAAENYRFVSEEDISKYPRDKPNQIFISQEYVGYKVIVALETCRKKEMAKEGISEDKSYGLPSTKKLLDYCSIFQRRFPQSSNAADAMYLAGNIHFGGKNYGEAISAFKMVVDQYPNSKIYKNAARMLGTAYSSNNQFDMAMQTFKALLAKTPRDTKEYEEINELAAGAKYKEAENLKKNGNLAAAAAAFQAIAGEFQQGKVAEKGWFEAGVCFEEMKDYDQTAAIFEQLTDRFPRGTLRESSYIRAAENYKKNNKYDRAAQVYLTAANQIPKAGFAIPSLLSASECYQKMNRYDMAGKMFELIYERYANDPKTPQALYNAGLIFEKGKHYHNAINVYETIASRYPNSEFAAEALYLADKIRTAENLKNLVIPTTPIELPTNRSINSMVRVVERNLIDLRPMYVKRLREKPDLSGKVTVKLVINDSGRVISAIVTESTMGDSVFEAVMVSQIKNWNFGRINKPKSVVNLTYPFEFFPKNMPAVSMPKVESAAKKPEVEENLSELAALLNISHTPQQEEIVVKPVKNEALPNTSGDKPKISRNVSNGSVTGGRSGASIEPAMTRNMATLDREQKKYCYGHSISAGRVTIEFHINEFGKVNFVKIVESTISNPDFEAIIVSHAKSWNFEKIDKPGDVTKVIYPISVSQCQ